jgi:hypothetical protein
MHRRFGTPPKCSAYEPNETLRKIEEEFMQRLAGAFERAGDHLNRIESVVDPDVVKVVRCKDCDVPHNDWTGCPNLNGMIPPPDFYCARGVRKEQDNG